MFGLRFAGWLGIAMATGSLPAAAQIVTDGSVGPAVELPGSDVEIGADLGRLSGGKLLHSFADFNIASGGSATFTGPAGLSDVIARVTGGSPSSLDGLLRSTVPGAALTFANPAGVLLGPNFAVDVPSAFHLTTADSLGFADGSELATAIASNASLSVAPLQSFGFLDATPGVIVSDGASFGVRAAQRLSLIAGDIVLDGGGQPSRFIGGFPADVRVASVAGAATVDLASGNVAGPGGAVTVSGLATLFVSGDGTGFLGVDAGTLNVVDGGILLGGADGSAEASGGITVVADDAVNLDGGTIAINNFGPGSSGGRLRLQTGSLSVLDGTVSNQSRSAGGAGAIEIDAERVALGPGGGISADAFADGAAGRVDIVADRVTLNAGGAVTAVSLAGGDAGSVTLRLSDLEIDGEGVATAATGILAGMFSDGDGRAGTIEITGRAPGGGPAGFGRAASVVAKRGGAISSINAGNGAGGSIRLAADRIEFDDQSLGLPTGLSASAQRADGGAGTIVIDAGELVVRDGASIAADADGDGDAGSLRIDAESILLSGLDQLPVQVSASSSIGGNNRPGTVTVRTGQLDLEGVAVIQASSFGTGPAGSIDIEADRIRLTGVDPSTPTGILSQANAAGAGAAGNIAVTARQQLVVEGFARIGSDSVSESGGKAGSVTVTGGEIIVRSQGAISSANVLPEGGAAGSIDVSGSRVIVDGGTIATFGLGATGGSIMVAGGEQILLNDATVLTTGVEFAPGTTLITLAAPLIVINSSRIFSTVDSTGPAVPGDRTSGSAAFLGDTTIVSTDSQILVTNAITVTGLEAEIGSDLTIDQPTLTNLDRLLAQACASARPDEASSLAVALARLDQRPPDATLGAPPPDPQSRRAADTC